MKVLFVSRFNRSAGGMAPFIASQLESLKLQGIDVAHFSVTGKGILGYFKSSRKLRAYLKKNDVDLVHAHYSLCGWTAVLAFSGKPVVLSLMGSDALGEFTGTGKTSAVSKIVVFLTFLLQPFVREIICKSDNIYKKVYRKKHAHIIPNGVRTDQFFADDRDRLKKALGLDINKKYVLFMNDPEHVWKNYELAEKAVSQLDDARVELLTPYPVAHEAVPKYLNAADILIMTSYMEGSSNVIKEAMACNCPLVSTRVGDVEWITKGVPGCYMASFEPEDVVEKLRQALLFSGEYGRTEGHQRILDLGLDAETVAGKIIGVYERAVVRW